MWVCEYRHRCTCAHCCPESVTARERADPQPFWVPCSGLGIKCGRLSACSWLRTSTNTSQAREPILALRLLCHELEQSPPPIAWLSPQLPAQNISLFLSVGHQIVSVPLLPTVLCEKFTHLLYCSHFLRNNTKTCPFCLPNDRCINTKIITSLLFMSSCAWLCRSWP